MSDNRVNEALLTTQSVIQGNQHPDPRYPGVRMASFDIDGQGGICVGDILSVLAVSNNGRRELPEGQGGSDHQCYLRIYVSHNLLINLETVSLSYYSYFDV